MTKRCFSGALAFLFSAAMITAHAQQDAAATPAPATADTAGSSKKTGKADPLGLGGMQKNRPKNAKTEITCKDEATFDNATGIAIFTTSVFVKDVQFNLYCDKLTVYLNKERKGIDHAEAEGHVVIVQENTNDKGEKSKSIGRSGHAVFTPATGEATLTIWPQLQQGINNHISTEEKTIMILNRDGRLKTIGGSRTVIIDADSAGSQ
jgi:lipopolysaccharide export system protein LptA